MEIRYHNPGLILIGLLLCAVVAGISFYFRKKQRKEAGIRAANTERLRALPIYRKKRTESLIYRCALTGGLVLALVSSLFLAARPYRRDTLKEDVSRRDIFLCMDLSSSSCYGGAAFVDEVSRLVESLDGDQIGISLFNTSSQQFVPVTDDYDFVQQRLGELKEYYEAAEEFRTSYSEVYEYVYEIPEAERPRYEELNTVLSSFDKGTTAGYEFKGTSAVAEGLASCLFSFPELYEEDRTRIILFVTDNMPELIGTPLTTLDEASDMCARDNVTVYGIRPEPLNTSENAEKQENARIEMKNCVESTGGIFFDYTEGISAERILEEIRNREIRDSRSVTATRETDIPELWQILLFAGLAAVLACLVFLFAKTGWKTPLKWQRRKKILSSAMAAVILLCAVMIAVRPMRIDDTSEIRTNNLDVCFVVDTTISMWAEDFNGEEQRIEGVRKDIADIMEALPGSSFALVRFDNGAQILAPFTQNFEAVLDYLSYISIPAYATAEGSSLNTSYDALAAMVTSSRERGKNRKTIVFLMSDGEITDGSELMSFSKLRNDVDDGLVLGYGTAQGGRMNYPGKGYIKDTSRGTDARSVIDEENLQSVAKDLGLRYLHRTDETGQSLMPSLGRIRLLSREAALKAGDRTGWKETYYYFAAVLAVVLAGCLSRVIRRGNLL